MYPSLGNLSIVYSLIHKVLSFYDKQWGNSKQDRHDFFLHGGSILVSCLAGRKDIILVLELNTNNLCDVKQVVNFSESVSAE